MEDNENIAAMTDEDVILPEGWTEGDNIFDPDSWGKGGAAPEEDPPAQEPAQDPQEAAQDPGGEGEGQTAPTTEQEAPTTEQEAPTTEPQSETKPGKLKFKARVDREDREVELDEGELPTIWQKAQATDRAQAREAQTAQRLDSAERMAKALGYDGLDSLLSSMEKKWQDSEVSRLVGEGVHEEVAREMVARRAQTQPTNPPAAEERGAPTQTQRDFQAEARQLLEARPDLRGKSIPDEVVRACVTGGKSLPLAYAEYETAQQRAEADKLRQENEVLKQNAANAARAPVKGVSGGGSTQQEPVDPFLMGFNSEY